MEWKPSFYDKCCQTIVLWKLSLPEKWVWNHTILGFRLLGGYPPMNEMQPILPQWLLPNYSGSPPNHLPYLSQSDHFGGILDRNPTFLKAKYDSRKILQVIERIGLFPFKNNFAEKNIHIKLPFRGEKFRYLSKIQSFSRFPLCQLGLFWTRFWQILLFSHISTP